MRASKKMNEDCEFHFYNSHWLPRTVNTKEKHWHEVGHQPNAIDTVDNYGSNFFPKGTQMHTVSPLLVHQLA